MSMDVRKLLVIHRLNLFWSAKKHLATSGEPCAHILAPCISYREAHGVSRFELPDSKLVQLDYH